MKIGFPVPAEGRGGTKTWMMAFRDYCISKGHQVFCQRPDVDVDVFITLADFASYEMLENLIAKKTKIIYRMDGIFFDYFIEVQSRRKQFNDRVAAAIMNADKVIYQSYFSKEVASQIVDVSKVPGTVIYNGADTKRFKPEGPILERPKDKKIVMSIAYWGPQLLAHYSIRQFIDIARCFVHHKDIEFWILGEAYPEDEASIIKANLPNITRMNLHEKVHRNNMPEYIRTADIIMHLRPNDACSNLIIEAMNVGKPVVGLDLGSTPELLGDAGLRCESEPSFEHFPKINPMSMYEQIIKTFNNYEFYKEKIIERSKMFTFEKMSQAYLKEIENVVGNK